MYGRRDLVDAHLFLRGRLSAAVLRSDPDSPDRPLRRTSTGMGVGAAVAAAAIVVVVVLNLFLFTTNDSWREQRGALLVDDAGGERGRGLGVRGRRRAHGLHAPARAAQQPSCPRAELHLQAALAPHDGGCDPGATRRRVREQRRPRAGARRLR